MSRADAGVHTDQCVCADCRAEWGELTDWGAYRRCPVCGQETGQPCVALSGAVEGGQPNGVLTRLETAHSKRHRKSGPRGGRRA